VEKLHYSSPEMYSYCRSCWITVLVLPTHTFGEAIIETSRIHNLFIQYPNITYFSALESPENGKKTHKIFSILIIVTSVSN
jgi:hypothetical protein